MPGNRSAEHDTHRCEAASPPRNPPLNAILLLREIPRQRMPAAPSRQNQLQSRNISSHHTTSTSLGDSPKAGDTPRKLDAHTPATTGRGLTFIVADTVAGVNNFPTLFRGTQVHGPVFVRPSGGPFSFWDIKGPTRWRFELVRAGASSIQARSVGQVDRAFRTPRFGTLKDPLAGASSSYALARLSYKHAALQ